MRFTHDDVRLLARTVRLDIPDEDIENVTLRLSALFAAMEKIEAELGPAMDAVDPVPPVYPHEDWNSSNT
jgi:Asp-tRNA(Asn)/Glu-tRNA(Gln) amidotransferase C subunit